MLPGEIGDRGAGIGQRVVGLGKKVPEREQVREAGMLSAESNQVRRPDREQVLSDLQGRGDRLLS